MAWRMYPCPNCGRPWVVCGGRCRRRNEDLYEYLMEKDEKKDVSFQCYACPNFIIFNSEDPNRIPRTIEKVNECFREMRGFYWDLMDNAKIPMTIESLREKHEVKAPLTTEDKEYLTHLLHVNETIHQLLAPHLICEDIPGDTYNHYMYQYEDFNKYFEKVRNTENLESIDLGNYWDQMTSLFEAVEKCFENYCKRKADN